VDVESITESAEHDVQEQGSAEGVEHDAEQLEGVATGGGNVAGKDEDAVPAIEGDTVA
jgi:hypothetical protein